MTKVTATKRIITVPEMIKAIKEHYNLNDTLLAINLNVSNQTVKAWKEGKKPRKDSYLALTELYKGINSEEQTEEVQEVTEVTEETEEKKPYEISYPNKGEKVYYISFNSGEAQEWDFDSSYASDKYLYEKGLYFDTKEEVEQFLKEQTLIKKIKCWAKEQQGDWEPDWSDLNQHKYHIEINRFNKEIICSWYWGRDILPKLPYFKSEEITQACIDEFGDEILEVFR